MRPLGKLPNRILWVEGKNDAAVVRNLCGLAEIEPEFEVTEKNGVDHLLAGFGVELRSRSLERFGLVVDANGSAITRWHHVRSVLADLGYTTVPEDLPGEGLVIARDGNLPRFGAWLMPDNGSPGALEDFVASLIPVAKSWLWKHAGDSIDAIPDGQRLFLPSRRTKAHIHTWLSWQEEPGSPMGQAIGKRDLDAHAPAAERFVAWLRRLMVSDEVPAEARGPS